MKIIEMFLQFGLRLAELVFRTGLQILVAVLTAAGKTISGYLGNVATSHRKTAPAAPRRRRRRGRQQWQRRNWK